MLAHVFLTYPTLKEPSSIIINGACFTCFTCFRALLCQQLGVIYQRRPTKLTSWTSSLLSLSNFHPPSPFTDVRFGSRVNFRNALNIFEGVSLKRRLLCVSNLNNLRLCMSCTCPTLTLPSRPGSSTLVHPPTPAHLTGRFWWITPYHHCSLVFMIPPLS